MIKKIIYNAFVYLIFVFVGLFLGGGTCQASTLTFGVYTSDKPSTMYKKFSPILDYLENQITRAGSPVHIELKIYPSYAEAITALTKGKCDLARFGPASYILAKDKNPNIRLLVMEQKDGNRKFNGVFITQKNSSINTIADLRGKTFAFGNEKSTIGRYLAQAELLKINITAKDLKGYKFLGRHDKVALAVSSGNYDAGVVKENTYYKYSTDRGLKKIGQFPNITKPWVVRDGFDPQLYLLLQKVLIGLNDKIVLKELKQDGFFKATDEEYDFIRQAMKISKRF